MVKNDILLEIQTKINMKAEEFAQEIAPIYRLLNWEWCCILSTSPFKTASYVPSKEDIHDSIVELSNELAQYYLNSDELDGYVTSGGLCVFFHIDEEDEETYDCGIKFVYEKTIYSDLDDDE